jgi:Flp pilus assembly protein TadG
MTTRHFLHRLLKAEDGAVAATVGISLFALIAAGGVAFDYARMASLDTELQSAADQAALAAATQLDGKTSARTRAINAAQALVANDTRFANDGGGSAVTVPTVVFYSAYTNPTTNTAATGDADAHFVKVTTGSRAAFFALTPIVAALKSGDITGEAVAGLGSAVCKVPPVMMCNPSEPLTNTNVAYDFDANALKGYGIKLLAGSPNAPGNFGFLDTQAGTGNGANELKKLLGYDVPPGNCTPAQGVDMKPGLSSSVIGALNTRFDIYDSNACPNSGTCSPSRNSRKDLVRGTGCTTGGGQGWQESPNPYRPTSVGPLASGYPDVMGYPRDYCHAVQKSSQTCGSIGTGQWDRDAYFRVNYGWTSASQWMAQTGLSASATRYEVYTWELAHTSVGSPAKGIDVAQTVTGGKKAYGAPACVSPGLTPGPSTVDRRRITVAVLNCKALGLNGADTNQPVAKWVDAFLVEPTVNRGGKAFTDDSEVYVEMIGETSSGTAGATGGQVVRHDTPYLIE